MMNKCIYVGKYPKIPFCKFSYCNVNIGTSIPTFDGFFKDIGTAICSDFGYIQSYIRSLEQHVTFSLRFNVTLISYIRLSTFILKLTEHTYVTYKDVSS